MTKQKFFHLSYLRLISLTGCFFILMLVIALYGCGNGGNSEVSITGGYTEGAILLWDPPETNVDGTPITDLAGYKIYYGTESGNYTEVIDVGNVTTYTITGLSPQTYYFAVTAYDQLGNESDYSNEVSKTILP